MKKLFKGAPVGILSKIIICALVGAICVPASAVFAGVGAHNTCAVFADEVGDLGGAGAYGGDGTLGGDGTFGVAGEICSLTAATVGEDGEICEVGTFEELQSAITGAVQSAAGAENAAGTNITVRLTNDITYSDTSSSNSSSSGSSSADNASSDSSSSGKSGVDAVSSATTSTHNDSSSESQVGASSFSSFDMEMPKGSSSTCAVTIDLCGHTLSVSAASAENSLFYIGNGCSLTINDSVGGGSVISALTCSTTASLFTILKGGTLTINNGTFKAERVTTSSCAILNQGGTAIINGGTFKASYYALSQERGNLSLSGGTFSVSDTARGVDICISSNSGDFTINACTFSTFHIDGYGASSSIYIADHLSENASVTKNGNPYAIASDVSQLGTSKDLFVIISTSVPDDGTSSKDNPTSKDDTSSKDNASSKDDTSSKGNLTFSDVPKGAWYADSLRENISSGLLSGYPDGTFKPNLEIKWCTLAQILYNFTDGYTLSNSDNSGSAAWYRPVMSFAQGHNLIPASDDSNFAEKSPTRYQTIQSFYKLGILIGAIKGSDIDTSDSGKDSLNWATENKILIGNQNGELMLDKKITRAEMSEIIRRVNKQFDMN